MSEPRAVYAGKPRFRLKPIVQTEAQVLRDVRRYLALHPKVSRLIRINSGACRMGDDEDARFVRFAEIEGQSRIRAAARRAGPIRAAAEDAMELVPDIVGFLCDGRFLAVEVKEAGWNMPRNPRERAQERFLSVVRHAGGVAGFVASLRDAERLLEGV